ncbi:TetR/AcrR family transcriptional regulator [Nocardioides sp. R-C-SC26]|uniref:TetR/AcrR family transcriptional regulator n=1 Tax=Nocardioides sp. R-C-SC26 TaxID=2870414 RepID=UPI001E35F013|nr:TetR family transcriptional regulator [Nocardioides sp. R-C-SC26]
MAQSANERRLRTGASIMLCAQELTDARGLDGFTMDDLSAACGVSRRTLFNYFPSKVDAILGIWPTLDDDDVDEFRSGGPDGDLLADLRTLIAPLLDDPTLERTMIARHRRILLANERLMTAVHLRYQALSADIVEHIVEREGAAFGARRARIAVNVLAAVFDSSIDEFLEDSRERRLLHHFDEALATARSLFGT